MKRSTVWDGISKYNNQSNNEMQQSNNETE